MDNKLIIKTAQDVINTELTGIKKLSKIIDSNFSNVIKRLSKVKGKVIFTGIGKSGLIAQKISSTMSSTGTPSQFFHSTEMSHGDLGAISKNDIIIILSNSGNSTELKGVINFCTKNKIFTIGISSIKSSYLIKSVNISLIIPSAEEACIIGMAPTT
jgi:arabinose-5-phosphate isomerase